MHCGCGPVSTARTVGPVAPRAPHKPPSSIHPSRASRRVRAVTTLFWPGSKESRRGTQSISRWKGARVAP